jgi:hypothetical protein
LAGLGVDITKPAARPRRTSTKPATPAVKKSKVTVIDDDEELELDVAFPLVVSAYAVW